MTQIIIDQADYRTFIRNLDEESVDELGDDYTACWLFAIYFHKKYNFPNNKNNCVYENTFDMNNINFENGIYSFYTENPTEMHHFILEVIDDSINLFSTYGGQRGIISIKHNKNNFIQLLYDVYIDNSLSVKDKIKKYKILFGIKCNIDKLDLTRYVFRYTFRNNL